MRTFPIFEFALLNAALVIFAIFWLAVPTMDLGTVARLWVPVLAVANAGLLACFAMESWWDARKEKRDMAPKNPIQKAVGDLEITRRNLKAHEEEFHSARQSVCDLLAELHGIATVELGTWECKDSPTGSCYYDDDEDPCHDSCLVCGDPDERK